jgi:hypothetical protein
MLIAVQLNELRSEQDSGLFIFHESGMTCLIASFSRDLQPGWQVDCDDMFN